jgi:hypothetical protein
MSVRFEHRLLQADRHISISFILDTSSLYNYYDTVSARLEHTFRRITQIITLLNTSSRKKYYNYVSVSFEHTLLTVNRHFRMSPATKLRIGDVRRLFFNMLSILSRHSLRSAAIFRTSPILETSKQNNYYIKVSVWFENPITSCPIHSILSSHRLHHVSQIVTYTS